MVNDFKPNAFGERNFVTQKLSACIEHVNKFDLGQMQRVVLEYKEFHVLILNSSKLIITIISNSNLDWGTLFGFQNELHSICDAMKDIF